MWRRVFPLPRGLVVIDPPEPEGQGLGLRALAAPRVGWTQISFSSMTFHTVP